MLQDFPKKLTHIDDDDDDNDNDNDDMWDQNSATLLAVKNTTLELQ
jgi:hypothetical protein